MTADLIQEILVFFSISAYYDLSYDFAGKIANKTLTTQALIFQSEHYLPY